MKRFKILKHIFFRYLQEYYQSELGLKIRWCLLKSNNLLCRCNTGSTSLRSLSNNRVTFVCTECIHKHLQQQINVLMYTYKSLLRWRLLDLSYVAYFVKIEKQTLKFHTRIISISIVYPCVSSPRLFSILQIHPKQLDLQMCHDDCGNSML